MPPSFNECTFNGEWLHRPIVPRAVIGGALLSVATVLACASAGGASTSRDCAVAARDSAFLARGVVHRDCAVDVRAALLQPITGLPDYQPTGRPPASGCISATIAFVVDTAGRVETATAKVLQSNDSRYASAVIAALPEFRFRPATKNGAPVRQIFEHKSGVAFMTVVVPAGQSPGAATARSSRPPRC